jgi:hypothetical protein
MIVVNVDHPPRCASVMDALRGHLRDHTDALRVARENGADADEIQLLDDARVALDEMIHAATRQQTFVHKYND